MSKFVHPARSFQAHQLKENKKNDNKNSNILIRVVVISLVVGLVGGILGQVGTNYLNKKDLLSIIEQSKQNFFTEKQTMTEKKEVIITQNEKVEQLISELAPTVVGIYKKKEGQAIKNFIDQIYSKEDLVGSGFIITNDGWIISNNQVIKDSIEKYEIVTFNGKVQKIENLIEDPLTGIIFLKIKTSDNLISVKLADWDKIKLGQTVLFLNKIGFLNQKFILSNIANLNFKNEALSSSEKIDKYILIQDKVEFNYNGSPLFNLKGEVVGIMAGFPSKNLTMAININYFKNIINKAIKTNKINKPYLGVHYVDLNNTSNRFGQNGALIIGDFEKQIFAIEKNSPAVGKLKEGDIIVKVENEEIGEKNSLTSLINEYQPNQNIKLTLIRAGKEMEIEVRLEKM
ncbi:MAG: trypsin-like peptidase domain-containing protein [Patescibacteria group bacterium]